ncbi:hypothetical protein JCM1840_000232 [Sporobolomyces johnsonii]
MDPLDATLSTEESLSALSSSLVSHGYLTRPLSLSTLFLPPTLPSNPSSKALKHHQDTLILQARARDQLARCLWGMLERGVEAREALEEAVAREGRQAMERERERKLRERAEREREALAREMEGERARAKEAEVKLKTEQERHRHARDELAKAKHALQFVKVQALHDQKRRESEVTALHARLQKLTSDSSQTRFVVLNSPLLPSSSSPSAASPPGPFSRSRLPASTRSPTPSSSSDPALLAELDLLRAALSELDETRVHLQGENTELRRFVGDVGEWVDGVLELEGLLEVDGSEGDEGGDEAREAREMLLRGRGSDGGDESFLIPTPFLSLPVPALTSPLHTKLYAIRLAVASLSSTATRKVERVRDELEGRLEEEREKGEEEKRAREEAEAELAKAQQLIQHGQQLVEDFAAGSAGGGAGPRRSTGDESDDQIPREIALALAAAKQAKAAKKAAKLAGASSASSVLPPSAPASSSASASSSNLTTSNAPRQSEPPSKAVADFLGSLGLDTPAAGERALLKREERNKVVINAEGKENAPAPPVAAARPSIARRPPSLPRSASSSASSRSSATAAAPVAATTSAPPKPALQPQPQPKPKPTSSALADILALADSPPPGSTKEPLVSSAAEKDKDKERPRVLGRSRVANHSTSAAAAAGGKREKDHHEKLALAAGDQDQGARKSKSTSRDELVRAKKLALREKAAAAALRS